VSGEEENLRGAFGDDLAFFGYLTEVYLCDISSRLQKTGLWGEK